MQGNYLKTRLKDLKIMAFRGPSFPQIELLLVPSNHEVSDSSSNSPITGCPLP